jgi:hypothetical protein
VDLTPKLTLRRQRVVQLFLGREHPLDQPPLTFLALLEAKIEVEELRLGRAESPRETRAVARPVSMILQVRPPSRIGFGCGVAASNRILRDPVGLRRMPEATGQNGAASAPITTREIEVYFPTMGFGFRRPDR